MLHKRSVAAIALAGGLVLLAATGCKAGPVRTASSAGPGTGGAGTVTVAIAEPVAVSGHAGAAVACSTGRIYTAQAQSVQIEGYQVFFTVRVAGYSGPGSYPAVVTLRLDNAAGSGTAVTAVPGVTADLTDTGGSLHVAATGDNGRTLDATLSWSCS